MACLPVFVLLTLSLIISFSLVLGFTMDNNNSDDETTRPTLKPWSDRWRNKRIGFHLKDVNPVLVQHSSALLPPADTCEASPEGPSVTRVFVPLCGKAIDMAYLATKTTATASVSPSDAVHVVGLEGIRVALEEFIEEQPELGISREPIPGTDGGGGGVPFERFVGPTVALWKGDYFDLGGSPSPPPAVAEALGTFGAVYDRASMVAIEPDLRERYVRILDGLLDPGGRILLVALERVASAGKEFAARKGPPYSVPEATVRELFGGPGGGGGGGGGGGRYTIEILSQTDQLVEKPEDKERYPELEKLLETVYLIRKEATDGDAE